MQPVSGESKSGLHRRRKPLQLQQGYMEQIRECSKFFTAAVTGGDPQLYQRRYGRELLRAGQPEDRRAFMENPSRIRVWMG